MGEYKFSVLLLQYNAVLEEIKQTIYSIISQSIREEIEIVVADDGSKEAYFDEIVALFKQWGFDNYSLVKNEKNQGTIKNIISGLKKCSGKYVKCISPGDYLYCDKTLEQVYDKMEKENAGGLFGKLAFYESKENKIYIHKMQLPFCTDVYERGNQLEIRKHLLIFQDNIPGAAVFAKRELFHDLMRRAEGKIIFQEDVTYSMLTFMNEKLIYMDEFVVWYEYGEGISTNGEGTWAVRLKNDTYQYFVILKELWGCEKYVRRAILFQKLEMKQGLFAKMLKTLLFMDRFLFRCNYVNRPLDFKEMPENEYLENVIGERGE